LYRNAAGQLVWRDGSGREVVGVQPVRAFPISAASEYVVLCDEEGREVGCVEDLALLSPEARKLLEEEIARHEFVPLIRRILHVSDDAEACEWQVETDHGFTAFRTTSDDAVRRLDSGGAMIVDVHGLRYLIPDTTKLDRAGRRLLDRFI
jgi:hypothetical protein